MLKKKIFQMLIVALLFAGNAVAFEKSTPIQVGMATNVDSGVFFDIPQGWKVYAHEMADTGSQLKIDLSKSDNLREYKILWPEYKISVDIIGHEKIRTFYYDGKVFVPFSLTPINPDKPIDLIVNIEYGACGRYCTVEFAELRYTVMGSSNASTLAGILFFAFLGGLILNIMPCVLPVVSIKLFGLVKHGNQSKKVITINLLVTAFGIIFSFMVLALATIFLKSIGETVGWGLHFQEPAFIMFLTMVLVIFATNLWGEFEINLPVWLSSKFSAHSSYGAYNSFLSGSLATLLATPCTAPFLGTSVAFAVSHGYIAIFNIFCFIGLGMASPYLLLAITPGALKLIPKPGAWMVTIKRLFSLMLLATAVWLLYVLKEQIAFTALLLFIGFLVLVKFTLSTNTTPKRRWLILLTSIIAAFVLPLNLNQTQENKKQIINSAWIKFDEDDLYSRISKGEVVLVDFTADWCITCKFNKFWVLDDIELTNYLKKQNVTLIRADITTRNNLYINFMLKRNKTGIPYNIIFGPKNPDGIELPTLLSKQDIIKEVEKQNEK